MQFIANGPDIPNALLQAHEDGRVVFFCGAGISYPAGLPGFKGLVEQIYQKTNTQPEQTESESFHHGRYDVTLSLLEQRLPNPHKQSMRSTLMKILKPKLRLKGATDTHTALLCLARSREGELRLVTTNFDRVFHTAARRSGQSFNEYPAPMLPIPKNSRWNGLVHLHGLLPIKNEFDGLNRLVLTSGDFGLAYLTERWAARFVSELFRNYVVCFVGYSINDPVLRYMMDALAADRLRGEKTLQAWALGDYAEGGKEHATIAWEAKGVTPILYQTQKNETDHSALHQTLIAWAATYRDGLNGKEAIVTQYAMTHPQGSTPEDDFVGRMLWALSDKSGLPAKRFANFNPAPSLDWLLGPFMQDRFGYSDLTCFGIQPNDEADTKLRFSLIQRPTPYTHAPRMQLFSSSATDNSWDQAMGYLAYWLLRHLNDPRLMIWISKYNNHFHNNWSEMLNRRLAYLAELESMGKEAELEEIRLHAPQAIPSARMRLIWQLMLGGRTKRLQVDYDMYLWGKNFKRYGLSTMLRFELRSVLSPKIRLSGPINWDWGTTRTVSNERTVEVELGLAADHLRYFFNSLIDPTLQQWKLVLPHLLDDFQQLLRDALDIMRELADERNPKDKSYIDLPSITPHWQNRGYHEWVILIELLRDAWLTIYAQDAVRAKQIAKNWFELPYPTFKRLALFAASHDDCISHEQWADWLLVDNAQWLWSVYTRREVCRLLVLQGRHLTDELQQNLVRLILEGPPNLRLSEDLDESIWFLLSKLNESKLKLNELAAVRLIEISKNHPSWKLKPDQSDEFHIWTFGTGDPGYENGSNVDIAPRKRQDLVKWLRKPAPDQSSFYEDAWDHVCRTRFFHSLSALCDLSKNNEWPEIRWEYALHAWAEKKLALRSWRYAAPLIDQMPDSALVAIAGGAARWMREISEAIDCDDARLFKLCCRLLSLKFKARSACTLIRNGIEIQDPFSCAINHPIGQLTQTLINLLFKQEPKDDELLPADFKLIFTNLCNTQETEFRHGRVLLTAHLIAFFRIDRIWTTEHLLPLFDWQDPNEAQAAWEGFLFSPRIHQPLLTDSLFKSQFLACANLYDRLGNHQQEYASFLTRVALIRPNGYTTEEFRSAIASLPQKALEKVAETLYQALHGAAKQSGAYWKSHTKPFWIELWPKSKWVFTPPIVESLAKLIVSAGEEFPAALNQIIGSLMKIERPYIVVLLLNQSNLCSQFPEPALNLLHTIIDSSRWDLNNLNECLSQIKEADPTLESDSRYTRLKGIERK